jgi:UDP-glucuronate 4-epimerase
MRALVTGAAGFIGSTLVDRLLQDGWRVVGIDSLSRYYDPNLKRANLRAALRHTRFTFIGSDLLEVDVVGLLQETDVVFHQAAQPGVRMSWSDGFAAYEVNNVTVTQRLLEAAKRSPSLQRFVYASSSSIYGEAARYPVVETDLPAPHSPYGVTKLAGEHLCSSYARNWGVPSVALRYFTVYGPRQRPDMAVSRLIAAAHGGEPFPLYGDGTQVRDLTHVGDVVAANVAAGTAELVEAGTVLNVAGGSSAALADLISLVEEHTRLPVSLEQFPPQPGDVTRTGADTTRAGRLLGWRPAVGLGDGIADQVDWQRRVVRAVP